MESNSEINVTSENDEDSRKVSHPYNMLRQLQYSNQLPVSQHFGSNSRSEVTESSLREEDSETINQESIEAISEMRFLRL